MKNFTLKAPLLVAATLATTVGSLPSAIAQSTAVTSLEEVVVTARRRSESLQDVPIAVTALSGDDLALRGASDISEIAQVVPSVTLEASRATNSTLTAFIRGVGEQDPLAGFEQGVALYIDDVYMARPQGSLLDIYDVERVEILRGPQGTLYGRNAVGGAIKYVTRRLGDEYEFRIKASAGSYDQQDFVATASLPFSDVFKLGATVASLTRDGYGNNHTTGGDNYDKDVFAYRLSAEFAPTEDFLVRLSYDHTDDDSSAVAGFRPFPAAFSGNPVLDDVRDTDAGATISPSTAGINGNNEVETEGLHLSIDWSLSDAVTVRSITAYREDYTESVIDFDSVAGMDFDAPVVYDNEQLSQEFQFLFNSDRFNAVAGAYYLDAKASNDFDVVLANLGVTAYTGGTVDTESWSVFADLSYDITDQLSLSVGGRYTKDERSADIFRGTYLGIGSPFLGNDTAFLLAATSDYEADREFSDFSPRVNISYKINDNTNIYAGYSQGWKAGSFDPRGANFVTPDVEKGFSPETLDSYELGLKTTWLNGKAITNIAVFLSDYEDMQIPGSVGYDSDADGVNDSFVGTVTNAGKAEVSGIELEGSFILAQGLTAQIALSVMNAEIEEWLFDGVDIADTRVVQNTPEKMAYFGLTYATEIGNGSLTFNANLSYKGDTAQFEIATPLLDQKAHSITNASVVWSSSNEQWLVGLHAKNLGDEDVKTSGYCFGSGGCPSTLGFEDNTTIFYAAPRTVTGTVEFRF